MKLQLKKLFFLIIAVLCLGTAFNLFMQPYNIVAGGVTGLALILEQTMGLNISITTMTINLSLIVAGYFALGKQFVAKTILGSTILFPLFIQVIPSFKVTDDMFLACIFGGLLTGVGITFLFYSEGSTGGTTVMAKMLNHFTKLPFPICMAIFDGIVILIGLFAFGIENAMYAMIMVFISTCVSTFIEAGLNRGQMIHIISDHDQEIVAQITNNLNRGVTILHGEGGYTNEQKRIIICVVDLKQLHMLKQITLEIDPNAFIIVNQASSVYGTNFRKLT